MVQDLLNRESIVKRSEGIAQRLFEDKMLLITAKDSKLHRLNSVGTFLWQVLENPTSVESLCKAIAQNFDDFDNLRNFNDIARFLLHLKERGLVAILPDGGVSS